MTEPHKQKHSGKLDEEFASTSNDDHRATADDRKAKEPLPQGGKGTPPQAEGDRDDMAD
jgi:hypothetical protein